MATVHAVNGGHLQVNQGFSKGRTLRVDQSNPSSGGFIASNIAEGHGRLNTGEFRQFLGIARASNFEVQTQLQLARELDLGNPTRIDEAEGLSNEVGKMIYAALKTLKT